MAKNISKKMQKITDFEIHGIPIFYYSIMSIIILVFWQLGHIQKTGIVGSFAFMWAIGFIFYAIGEKLPIWRTYIGGGMIMAFIGSASLVYIGAITNEDAEFLKSTVIDNKFLYLLLTSLIAASILSIPSKILIKSLFAYVPIILSSLTVAMIMGVLAGFIFGIQPSKIITHYVLPIMGGGNGAGAIPMAEIYSDATGNSSSEYYSFAISVLTLANIVAIIFAATLHQIGLKFPSLTGNGELLINAKDNEDITENIKDQKKINTHGALFFTFSILLICFFLYSVFPTIHLFAWVVILVIALSAMNIVSPEQKAAIMQFSEWGMKIFLVLVLVSVGLITDLNELLNALNFTNIIIATFIVFGAVIGSAICGRFFNFYPIEAAICAGLCMANRGGSGDLEVLGASKRMKLYPYAQVSSRIGGGIVLFIAGLLFSYLT